MPGRQPKLHSPIAGVTCQRQGRGVLHITSQVIRKMMNENEKRVVVTSSKAPDVGERGTVGLCGGGNTHSCIRFCSKDDNTARSLLLNFWD